MKYSARRSVGNNNAYYTHGITVFRLKDILQKENAKFCSIRISIQSIRIIKFQNRRKGELIRPLRATDISLERYVFHRPALKACLQKCVDDLTIDPTKYRVIALFP